MGRRCYSISVASSVGGHRSLRGACREITPSQNTDIYLVRKKNRRHRERIFEVAMAIWSGASAQQSTTLLRHRRPHHQTRGNLGSNARAWRSHFCGGEKVGAANCSKKTDHARVKTPHEPVSSYANSAGYCLVGVESVRGFKAGRYEVKAPSIRKRVKDAG